jgi:membrane fusion protein, copper/silver efflux system
MKKNKVMNRKRFLKIMFIGFAGSLLITGCREKQKNQSSHAKAQTYTCSMHPQIIQDKPGTCPICGMDLVPFDKNNTDPSLMLSESQKALANITTITVGGNSLSGYKQLNGRLTINPEQTVFVSSRVAGRIEQLYVKQTGVQVSKGQPLYRIYSEELSSLQQEYLLSIAQASAFPDNSRFQEIAHAARQKLLLYGQSETQLKQLSNNKKSDPYVTYYSGVSGVVAELSITEGQYVTEGGPILRLENYNTLWVEADVYPSEASNIRKGQKVNVTIAGWEDQPQSMTIRFITPALETGGQTIQIRGGIPNVNNQWQPGLQASILLPSVNKTNVLTLPLDAIIREEQGIHVWIEGDSSKYEPRMVKIGAEDFDKVEIIEGLIKGDKVVVTGAYLLYSEFILKKGRNPMAGHNH